jgi:hypothetical protein
VEIGDNGCRQNMAVEAKSLGVPARWLSCLKKLTSRDPMSMILLLCRILIPIRFQDKAKARRIIGLWRDANEEHIRMNL